MEILELIDNVVGVDQQGKCKNTIAFFVEKNREGADSLILEEFMVEKPVVNFSDFSDENGNVFFNVEFVYKSCRDEDLKQQWQLFDRFVKRVNNTEQEEELPVLSISIIPISLRGKYSVLIESVLPDSLVKVEYAGESICTIRALAFKEDVSFLKHDDELIDRQQIEAEVSRDIDVELGQQSDAVLDSGE